MADEVDITNARLDAEMEALLAARKIAQTGDSLGFCIDCDEEIPQARRDAIKGCQRCVCCQEKVERL